jgi:hypothetical protein
VIRKKVKRFEIVSFTKKLHPHLTIANMYFSGTVGATMARPGHACKKGLCVDATACINGVNNETFI